jgi:sterol desaturase/sphingolipid hydroxylase (fatty acid hydroxylase superfamily)
MLLFAWAWARTLSGAAAAALGPYEKYTGQLDPDRLLLTMTFASTHTTVWLVCNAFFCAIKNSRRFEHWRSIPSEISARQNTLLIREAVVNAVANHLMLQFLFTYYVIAPLFAATGALRAFASEEMPPFSRTVVNLGGCILLQDGAFYWMHRLLHQPLFYHTVHRRHHAFRINHPIAVEHAHIAESVIGHLFPMLLPCVLLRIHGSTFMLWFGLMLAEGIDAHSGYTLQFSPFRVFRDPRRHQFHHSRCGGAEGSGTSGVYGSWLHFWDWLTGTDAPFLAYTLGNSTAKRGRGRS